LTPLKKNIFQSQFENRSIIAEFWAQLQRGLWTYSGQSEDWSPVTHPVYKSICREYDVNVTNLSSSFVEVVCMTPPTEPSKGQIHNRRLIGMLSFMLQHWIKTVTTPWSHPLIFCPLALCWKKKLVAGCMVIFFSIT
jgi:hypothetical protein